MEHVYASFTAYSCRWSSALFSVCLCVCPPTEMHKNHFQVKKKKIVLSLKFGLIFYNCYPKDVPIKI